MQKTHCISLQASLLAGYYCIKYGIRTPPPLRWGPVEFFWGKFKQLEDFLWGRVKIVEFFGAEALINCHKIFHR